MSALTARAKAAEAEAEGVRHYRVAIVTDRNGGRVLADGTCSIEEAVMGLSTLVAELAKRQVAAARATGVSSPATAKVSFRPPRVA